MEDSSLPSATRKAFLRGACLGSFLVVPSALVGFCVVKPHATGVADGALAGLIFGAVTAPSTIFELIGARWEPFLRRDVVVALSTAVLAAVALVFAWFETLFDWLLLATGSPGVAMQETQRSARQAFFSGAEGWAVAFALVFALTLPFVSIAVGRLRMRSLREELGAALACGVLAVIPTVAIASILDLEPWRRLSFVLAVPAIVNALSVVFLSCACRLADRVDRTIVDVLRGRHTA